jgi:hypothetical protein
MYTSRLSVCPPPPGTVACTTPSCNIKSRNDDIDDDKQNGFPDQDCPNKSELSCRYKKDGTYSAKGRGISDDDCKTLFPIDANSSYNSNSDKSKYEVTAVLVHTGGCLSGVSDTLPYHLV